MGGYERGVGGDVAEGTEDSRNGGQRIDVGQGRGEKPPYGQGSTSGEGKRHGWGQGGGDGMGGGQVGMHPSGARAGAANSANNDNERRDREKQGPAPEYTPLGPTDNPQVPPQALPLASSQCPRELHRAYHDLQCSQRRGGRKILGMRDSAEGSGLHQGQGQGVEGRGARGS